jgi:PAS domain-containing protein
MTSTDPSTTPGTPTPDRPTGESGAGRAELARAAAELEALADAYDDCTRSLETMEATVDSLLDDRSIRALVLDADRRVTAVSRGMAALLGGEQVLGRRAATLVPPTWTGLDAALDTLTVDEGWRELPVGDAGERLRVRRATDNDRSAVYVLRYEDADA